MGPNGLNGPDGPTQFVPKDCWEPGTGGRFLVDAFWYSVQKPAVQEPNERAF